MSHAPTHTVGEVGKKRYLESIPVPSSSSSMWEMSLYFSGGSLYVSGHPRSSGLSNANGKLYWAFEWARAPQIKNHCIFSHFTNRLYLQKMRLVHFSFYQPIFFQLSLEVTGQNLIHTINVSLFLVLLLSQKCCRHFTRMTNLLEKLSESIQLQL